MRNSIPRRKRTGRRALLRRFKPGERIAVWAYNLPEWVMMEFGAAMAGMGAGHRQIPAFAPNEVEYVLKQSRAAGVFVVPAFRGNPMLGHGGARGRKPVARNCARSSVFEDWGFPSIAAGDDRSIALAGCQAEPIQS